MGGIILKFVEIFIISRFPWKNINRKTGRSDGGIQFTYKSGYFIISPSAAFLAAVPIILYPSRAVTSAAVSDGWRAKVMP